MKFMVYIVERLAKECGKRYNLTQCWFTLRAKYGISKVYPF